jgi:hypothetical protein
MSERTQIAFKLVLTHIILLPALILVSFTLKRDGFLSISIIQTILIILYFSGYWEFFGFTFRISYSAVIEALLLIELVYKGINKSSNEVNLYLVLALLIMQAYLLYELLKIILTIYKKENVAVEIAFPFKNGKYLITDGGNSRISRLMNYHYYSRIHKKNRTNNSMLFATDIVKIEDSGKSFLPKLNEHYPIFRDEVFCPVGGVIVKVVNDIDDNVPYCGNYPYNTGNTVVIKDENRFLLMGHLRKGSVKVSPGAIVNSGDLIAEAGNSGYSERPHLHMQLIESDTDDYWKGTGVSIHFRNKNLFKNRIIRVKKIY